ncbi:MAG: cupin domain-containing protein [Gaiellaceae bacterium]
MSKKSAHENIAHWDEIEVAHWQAGHISADWRRIGPAVGAVGVGLSRIQIAPGMWSTPAHTHGREEEIFFVLGGSGLLWQDGANFDIAETDCFAFRGGIGPHTLKAGPEGLDVLAFSENIGDSATFLPRSKVSWLGVSWVETGTLDNPFGLEAAQGPPEVKESSALRPDNLARLKDVSAVGTSKKTIGRIRRNLGDAVGSRTSGLGHVAVAPGKLSCPPHCHSSEEELFVVLEGEGVLLLGDEEYELRQGHVVARPPGTGVAHVFRGAGSGLTLLAYGTRRSTDLCFYPRSRKISFRGLGVIGRISRVDYWDGEE